MAKDNPQRCRLTDIFPAFLSYWTGVQGLPLDEQISRWANEYLSPWPDLLAQQVEDYASQQVDWRQIAREKVFPHLSERLPAMRQAHDALVELCEPIVTRARQALGFDGQATFVIHVGIGCGAGWATTFRGRPAVLFGLENVAECGWTTSEALAGLVAHEIGHLAHQGWRAQRGMPEGSGPWWQLYEEGFAQHCESLILGAESWHQAGGGDGDWLEWCRAHAGWLAAEFMRTADAGKPVSAFFGSWHDVCGRSQTGYFLGREVIKELAETLSLKQIALLEAVEGCLRPALGRLASG
jgi:hypothetical protein